MYAVAKRYTVAVFRERLSDALDEAQKGNSVIIERRGTRYRLSVDSPARRPPVRRSKIEILDPAVESGTWTWQWAPDGLSFRRRRS
jgi:antitoxin (DNA-binding transcriptional repressor) of toxin-antitoxin stability system